MPVCPLPTRSVILYPVWIVRSLAQSVKIMIAIAIFLTYSLQFYVPFEIIWKGTKHRYTSRPMLFEYLLRVSLVVGTGKSISSHGNRLFAIKESIPPPRPRERHLVFRQQPIEYLLIFFFFFLITKLLSISFTTHSLGKIGTFECRWNGAF